MGRSYLAGAVAIPEDQVRRVLRMPFLGLFYVGRGDNVRLRERSLKDLGVSDTRYDEARGIWFFKLVLHDDDLANASFDPLRKLIETVPSVPDGAFVASRDDWQDGVSWFAFVSDGRAVEWRVSETVTADDEGFVTAAQAREIIAKLPWTPAVEVISALAQR
jgi:hypothetical protein